MRSATSTSRAASRSSLARTSARSPGHGERSPTGSRHDAASRSVRLAYGHERATRALAGRSLSRGAGRAGWDIEIVAFEPAAAQGRRNRAGTRRARGGWNRVQLDAPQSVAFARHEVAESMRAFFMLLARALRRRPRIVHARSYLPGAVAQLVSTIVPQARFIFDCRGLLGDEYVDFGHWSRDSFRYRLLKRSRRQLFGRADASWCSPIGCAGGCATRRAWSTSASRSRSSRAASIVERFRSTSAAGDRARVSSAPAIASSSRYSGTLDAWYCEEQMAELFAAIRRRRPALFAVFTRASSRAAAPGAARGVASRTDDRIVRSATQREMPACAERRRRRGVVRRAALLEDRVVAGQGRRVPGGRPARRRQPRRRRSGRADACANRRSLVDAGAMAPAELDARRGTHRRRRRRSTRRPRAARELAMRALRARARSAWRAIATCTNGWPS